MRQLKTFPVPSEALDEYLKLRDEATLEIATFQRNLDVKKNSWQARMERALVDLRIAAEVPFMDNGMDVVLQGSVFVESPRRHKPEDGK